MITTKALDQAERAVLRSFAAGELRSVNNALAAKTRYQQYASLSLRKPRTINIRIAERDLQQIKVLAAVHGIPYQTFISALLHQYSAKKNVKTTKDALNRQA